MIISYRDDGSIATDLDGNRLVSDSSRVVITNNEVGFYGGLEKKFIENKLKLNLTGRVDKNENFDFLFSPAASLVYSPNKNRVIQTYPSPQLVRNPTLEQTNIYSMM